MVGVLKCHTVFGLLSLAQAVHSVVHKHISFKSDKANLDKSAARIQNLSNKPILRKQFAISLNDYALSKTYDVDVLVNKGCMCTIHVN